MTQVINNSIGLFTDRKTPQDVFLKVAADTTLTPRQNIVHVAGFAGAVALTLPPVADCAGAMFAISVLDDASVNNVTITDQGDSLSWADQVVSGATGGEVLIFCDGMKFWVVHATLT